MATNRNLILTLGFALICLFTIGAYWQGLHGPFFLDDQQSIEPARMSSFSLASFLAICFQNDTGPLGRPLSIATFALNSYFFGDAPFGFKAVNLGLHLFVGIAVAFFVYFLIRLLPKHKKFAYAVSLLCTTLWLIHPLQVSTVLYPVQRMTQLCHLFILLGLNTYLLGRIRHLTGKTHSLILMLISFMVFFPLSLLSKETGVLFIWYAFCVEYFVLKFRTRNKTSILLRRTHYVLSSGLLIGGLCYYWLHLSKYLSIFAEKNISLFERLMTQTKVVLFYAQLILLPQISKLGLYHDDFPLSKTFDLSVALSSLILLLAGFVVYYFRKRAPIASFGIAWFLVSQAIESTLLPLELVFEHRNYLASIGLLLIISFYVVNFFTKAQKRARVACSLLLLTLISLLLTVTTLRSFAWSSSQRFLAQELAHHPKSGRVHIELANWFLIHKNYDAAFSELDYAQILQPYNAGIALHKILIFCHGKSVPSELYQDALIKIRQGAITPYVIVVLDQMVQNMFSKNCDAIDKKELREIIQQAMENPFLWYKPMYKAVLFHLDGGIALLQHDVDESRYLLKKSFETFPKRIDPLIQKAYLEIQSGKLAQAQETVDLIAAHSKGIHYSDNIDKLIKVLHEEKSRGRSQ